MWSSQPERGRLAWCYSCCHINILKLLNPGSYPGFATTLSSSRPGVKLQKLRSSISILNSYESARENERNGESGVGWVKGRILDLRRREEIYRTEARVAIFSTLTGSGGPWPMIHIPSMIESVDVLLKAFCGKADPGRLLKVHPLTSFNPSLLTRKSTLNLYETCTQIAGYSRPSTIDNSIR